MKKVFTLVAVASITALVACGPSAEEKAKMEKAKQDSTTAADAAKAAADAAAKATADSTANYASMQEQKAKATADSIAAAESAPKKGGKATTKPKAAEPKKGGEVKAGQGKG